MDHPLYPYSALPARAATAAPLSAYVVLCLEHWEAVQPEGAVRDPRFVGEFGSFTPDYRSWTQREYGLRIGVFRVLQALRDAGIRPAIAANARAVERLPGLVEELNAWDCEWIGHGLCANAMMHSRMPLPEQRNHIAQSLDALERCTGQRPTGWLSQDWGTSPATCSLLVEAGVRYTLDWSNDDQAYRMTPPLTALPLSAEWDDVQCQWLRNLTPRAHADLALQAFDRLRKEGGAVFGLALHPWVSGMSSRIGPLRELLLALHSREGVRWASPGELAK